MAPLEIIKKYYALKSRAFDALVTHSSLVAEKALKIGRAVLHMNPDLQFIQEAAMLHDIGIIRVHAPDIGCTGEAPYICHGVLGRRMLEEEGLPRHALVCERHVGAGITAEEITAAGLPLPVRDMRPVSIEEMAVAYADKFFSKNPRAQNAEKPIDEVLKEMERYGPAQVERFLSWVKLFEPGMI
ncbi:MAG: HD domain-containing protein [Thermodesulfobacteriota bacterium]